MKISNLVVVGIVLCMCTLAVLPAAAATRGNTLITDPDGQRVFEVGSEGNVVWEVNSTNGLSYPMSADRLPNGNTLVSDLPSRVVEFDGAGNIVWEVNETTLLESGEFSVTGIRFPDAHRLPDSNTLIAVQSSSDAEQAVIEVDSDRNIIWRVNTTTTPELYGCFDLTRVQRLPDGNTLIVLNCRNKIIEVDPAGCIVWEINQTTTGLLHWPFDDRLPNGNTLICDTDEWTDVYRVIEVDYATKKIVWEINQTTTPGLCEPMDAERLPDGNTLLVDYNNWNYPRVIEVDSAGNIVWEINDTSWSVWIWIMDVDRIQEPAPPLEFGDAPDPTHPSLLASDGARHNITDTEFLGLQSTGDGKDFEPNANVPNADLFDDGLLTLALTTGNPAQTVDFEVTNNITDDQTLIVNILLDLNGDGDWNDVVGGQSEHVVQNQALTSLVGIAEGVFTSTPFSTVGATPGQTWMRITLTRHTIASDWNGTMASVGYTEPFECGETEDWLVELQAPDLTPTALTAPALFAGEPNTISATIANIGTLGAGSFNVSLSADDNQVDTASVASLAAGASTDVSFSWTPAGAGSYNLCVVADCDGGVDEGNETNNETCEAVDVVIATATVFFVPDDIRLPKYCDTTNVGIWIDTEEVITSGRMEFDYADCCMNVTGYEMNTTNWVPGSSDMVLTSGKVRTTLLAPGSGVGPGLLHVGDITVHCCNDTGYCFTDLTWNKTGGAAGFYLWNDASAMLDFIDWQDGTFRCNIPDLTITMVKGNEINATHYNVSYTVKNVGEVDAAASYVNLLVDGSQVETMPIPVLTPGEEKAYSFVSEINQTGTVDHLLVCADYDDAVVELDETNNCMIGRYPGEVVINVQPAVTYVQPQDQFDVKIYVDTKGIDVYAVQYRLTYNTSIVRAETQTKDTFLGPISETMVVVNEIDQPHGEVSYAETRKVPGAVTESGNVTNIHFIAIGVRGATTPLTLDDIIISDENGVAIAYVIDDGTVEITENTAPVPIGATKHRINNVAQKYQSTAVLCSCSYDPDYPGKGGNISYIRWAFGDGQYGTSEGLPDENNCTCKEHKYESWQWDPLGDSSGNYVPFDVQLDVMDDGCPELTNTTNFTINVYIAGDANGDGEVNILDAVWVGKNWRAACATTPCANCEGYLWADEQPDGADLNNDCEINILDAVIVGANWRHVAW